jgi:NAD(P)-dependent dehydrogenase (short-subunit alcohol dehydrogenase family)
MPDLHSSSAAFSLAGELAVITGGGTGLGLAIASCFLAAGARIVITGRRNDVLQSALSELGPGADAIVHDVSALESASGLVDEIKVRHGLPTILVNNAGMHVKKTITDTSIEDFRQVLGTHVDGAFAMTRAVVPSMKVAGHGSIIFIASMSSIIGMPMVVAYSAAKAAYLGMVRSLASELGPDSIRVNAIAPGWIETEMLHKALDGDAPRKNKILSRTPQQRFGSPQDIGWSATFLCSPAANFINGALLPVDGGASIGF